MGCQEYAFGAKCICNAVFGSSMIMFLLLLLRPKESHLLQRNCRRCDSFCMVSRHAPRGFLGRTDVLAWHCRETLLVDTPSITPGVNSGLRCDIIRSFHNQIDVGLCSLQGVSPSMCDLGRSHISLRSPYSKVF